MNKREAKREAHRVAADLIWQYVRDYDGMVFQTADDEKRYRAALDELAQAHYRISGGAETEHELDGQLALL